MFFRLVCFRLVCFPLGVFSTWCVFHLVWPQLGVFPLGVFLCLVCFSADTTPFWALPEVNLKCLSHKHRPIFAKSSTSGLREPFPLPLRVRSFVPSRVSSFPAPRSHVSTWAFVFLRRAGPGRLHLPNSDAHVPRLLRRQTDLPSVAFSSPCSPPYYS